ncbi:MAG TPA: DUF998 domain-containing protein [Allosphingosinicella sp.]
MAHDRSTAFLGLAASVLFFLALSAFGALDPAYSHTTKAVSELGSVGAPNQLSWNLIGFLAVGVLLALFGWRLGGRVDDRAAKWSLMLFGLSFAATAIPADMNNLRSAGSTAHIVASIAAFLFWALALIRLVWINVPLRGLKLVAGIALVLAVGSIILRTSELLLPGLAQRISFSVMFGWVAVAAILLLRSAGEETQPRASQTSA